MIFQFTKIWFSTSNISKTAKQKKKILYITFITFSILPSFFFFPPNIPKKHYAKEEIKKHFYIDSFLCFDKLKLHWVLPKFTANMQSAKYFSLNSEMTKCVKGIPDLLPLIYKRWHEQNHWNYQKVSTTAPFPVEISSLEFIPSSCLAVATKTYSV